MVCCRSRGLLAVSMKRTCNCIQGMHSRFVGVITDTIERMQVGPGPVGPVGLMLFARSQMIVIETARSERTYITSWGNAVLHQNPTYYPHLHGLEYQLQFQLLKPTAESIAARSSALRDAIHSVTHTRLRDGIPLRSTLYEQMGAARSHVRISLPSGTIRYSQG